MKKRKAYSLSFDPILLVTPMAFLNRCKFDVKQIMGLWEEREKLDTASHTNYD